MCVVPHPVVSNGRGASNSGFVITWRCKLGLRNDLALQTLTNSNMGGTANVPYWCFVSVEQNNCDLFEILGAANCATTSLRGVANCDIGAHCWTNSADDLLLLLMLLLLLLLICVCHCLAYLRVCKCDKVILLLLLLLVLLLLLLLIMMMTMLLLLMIMIYAWMQAVTLLLCHCVSVPCSCWCWWCCCLWFCWWWCCCCWRFMRGCKRSHCYCVTDWRMRVCVCVCVFVSVPCIGISYRRPRLLLAPDSTLLGCCFSRNLESC